MKQSIPKVKQSEASEPTKILVRRKSKEINLHEEESNSNNEVVKTPLDVFRIYYLTTHEIVVD